MFTVLLLTLAAPADIVVINKCPTAPLVVPPLIKDQIKTGYPLRPKATWWTGCSDWTHLTQGEHAGKYDPEWLKTLSAAELQSLHSDDHDKKVQMDYVKSGYNGTAPVATSTITMTSMPYSTVFGVTSTCPGGNCPQQTVQFESSGPIRRFFRGK